MDFLNLTTAQWQQIGISAAIVAAALVLARPILTFLLDQVIGRLTGVTKSNLDDLLLDALRPPLFWLVILLAVEAALNRLSFLSARAEMIIDNAAFVLYAVLLLVAILRLVRALSQWLAEKINTDKDLPVDNQMLPFIQRILNIIIVAIAVIIVLGYFDIEITGLVTTLGIGSLAVALAAQETLADTISGFAIMFDQPFRIGDRIEILELDTWGDVQDIGLRSTRIRTMNNRMVIVPNSVIGKSLVVNHSYPNTQIRSEIHVGVAYGTDIEQAREVLIKAVEKVEGVDHDFPVEALFLEFGDSALIFRVRWWLDSYVDTRRMFDKVNTAMYNALNEAGIEIPFPQRDVYHKLPEGELEKITRAFNK
jgi:small-conductance mechanosensitive channel